MILKPSDPDIETIKNRISRNEWNLQPEFQRGEVWSLQKKQRLIDSVLREWHVPPIHIIDNIVSKTFEVLDGQQRLASIRDFIDNQFNIDGSIEPFDEKIKKLNGLKFRDLDDDVRRKILGYTMRVFTISNYQADEPAELFYRLNQPTNLTSAEKRNAFFGPVREQIKLLKSIFENQHIPSTIGFSNARMAYEDILAKYAIAIEEHRLNDVTAAAYIAQRFREKNPIEDSRFKKIRTSVEFFTQSCLYLTPNVKFNKASLFSWFVFTTISEAYENQVKNYGNFLNDFESLRWFVKRKEDDKILVFCKKFKMQEDLQTSLIEMFTDRSASRSSNISSILLRDLILGIFYVSYVEPLLVNARYEKLNVLIKKLKTFDQFKLESDLLKFVSESSWSSFDEI